MTEHTIDISESSLLNRRDYLIEELRKLYTSPEYMPSEVCRMNDRQFDEIIEDDIKHIPIQELIYYLNRRICRARKRVEMNKKMEYERINKNKNKHVMSILKRAQNKKKW